MPSPPPAPRAEEEVAAVGGHAEDARQGGDDGGATNGGVKASPAAATTCPGCTDPWSSDGAPRICCIPSGHVYGRRSCPEKMFCCSGDESAKVAVAEVPNRIVPAAACMHHAHFRHSLLKRTPKAEHPATCELCEIAGEGSLAGCTGEASEARSVLVAELEATKMRVHTLTELLLEELEAKKQMLKAAAAQGEVRICKPCDAVVNNEKANEHGGHLAPTPAAHRMPATEYLEVKKRRLLNAGAAQGEVRICKMCNVVVSSHTVYLSHIKGKKHNAKMRKQQRVLRRSIARDKERM